MSKTQLKKTLSVLSADDMRELILSLYEARAEAKDYLDFFVNPDIDRRLEKARAAIRKEMFRTSRGYNKARSTRIRRFINDISSLDAGDEAVCEIMTYAVECAAKAGSDQTVKEVTQKGMCRLLSDTVRFADRVGLLGVYLPRITAAVDDMNSNIFRKNLFKRVLKETLEETLNDL